MVYHGSTIWSTMVSHTQKPWFNHGIFGRVGFVHHEWTSEMHCITVQ